MNFLPLKQLTQKREEKYVIHYIKIEIFVLKFWTTISEQRSSDRNSGSTKKTFREDSTSQTTLSWNK